MITLIIADILIVILFILGFIFMLCYLFGYGISSIGNKIQNKIWKRNENESEEKK